MSSLTFYLLACSMCVAIVSSCKIRIPSVVDHPDRQCLYRNYRFACRYYDEPFTVNCKNLECAGKTHGKAVKYRSMRTGRPARGTVCGERKICYAGDCIDLPDGVRMPRQVGEVAWDAYCWRSGGPANSG